MESEVVSQAVEVSVTGEWKSGNSTMNVTLHFTAASLDEALRMVHRASDGAPSFKNPLEEGQP
jgi:hypothetical protein